MNSLETNEAWSKAVLTSEDWVQCRRDGLTSLDSLAAVRDRLTVNSRQFAFAIANVPPRLYPLWSLNVLASLGLLAMVPVFVSVDDFVSLDYAANLKARLTSFPSRLFRRNPSYRPQS